MTMAAAGGVVWNSLEITCSSGSITERRLDHKRPAEHDRRRDRAEREGFLSGSRKRACAHTFYAAPLARSRIRRLRSQQSPFVNFLC